MTTLLILLILIPKGTIYEIIYIISFLICTVDVSILFTPQFT